MSDAPSRPPAPRPRQRLRLVGGLLLGLGGLLVTLTALVATGVVPLWRPSVPPPPALVEAQATRVTLASNAVRSATSTPLPSLPGAAVRPPLATRPTPFAVPGAPPEGITAARPAVAAADRDAGTDAGATALGLPTPLPPYEPAPLPTLPPPPTLITSALPSSTPRPTAVPPPPAPGLPTHLVIPRIHVDTTVVELSTALDARGVPQWETVPFVAGHYRMTGLAGARTNVVLSGHVVTRDMGNVFRDLHLLRPGDPVVVYTEQGQFTYRVSELRLVDPADTSVLAPSSTPQLSLITCAGEFDFRTRTFNQRLVVVGELVTT
jgi:LPXTG-site transpeptidase (sortase) family protein